MRIIAIVNRKGGVGKSTLALGLSHVLAKRGRTALIDTDPETSAVEGLAEDSPVDAVPLDVSSLAELLSNPEITSTYQYVIIDTPPNSAEAIDAATAAADLIVIPMGASAVEFARLGRTIERVNGARWVVVPNRIRLSTAAGRSVQDICRENGITVTRTSIPLREALPQSVAVAVMVLGRTLRARWRNPPGLVEAVRPVRHRALRRPTTRSAGSPACPARPANR